MSSASSLVLGEPGIARHDALGHQRARIDQVLGLPLVGVLAADAGEIGPGALGAPLEGMVVHALGGEAVVAVALHLVAQRADHLAVAAVAALAHVDVAAGLLERRVGAHALHLLDRALDPEQRRDLHDAADRDRRAGCRSAGRASSSRRLRVSSALPPIPPPQGARRARRRCGADRPRRRARRRGRCARCCRP